MPALKEIGNLANRTGVSCLTQSPLWHQDVATITLVQVFSFIAKMKLNNRLDEAETAVEIVMQEVHQAVARNEIDVPPMLSYERQDRIYLTAGELRRGLMFLGHKRAAAILFALETEMDLTDAARLTYRRLAEIKHDCELSEIANACLEQVPQHIRSPYVFWQERADGTVTPLFGLDEAVFDAFGLVWAELMEGYENLIMIDEDADRASIECFVRR